MARKASHPVSDKEVIHLILKEGSPQHFQVLYQRYYQKVLDKCFSMVKDRVTAEELAEDIFSKVYENLATFLHRSSFSSWLYSITYNHCVDFLREKKSLHYPNWNRDNEIPEIVDESGEIEKGFNYDNLMTILDRIHTEEKALLLMKYQDELSIKQISSALRITEAAAKMRLKRARTRVLYLYNKTYM
jgi:RNA polymerase sigma-70 factor (ECF subfamily)